jgi:malonyl CoA-acyl carrier protein transacylase
MYDSNIINFFDVYSVGENGDAIQFERVINLIGINGERVAIRATFDDGAMVNVIDLAAFEEVKNQLSKLRPSKKVMRMVNGALIPLNSSWSGVVVIGDVHNRNI